MALRYSCLRAWQIKLIECPRDAWQGLPGRISTAVKVQYLRALIGAGFKHIDAVSFVSPKAVPQMADSEEVLRQLDPPDDVEIIGIVVNEKGAERAIATEAVRTLGFPYSLSETFLKKNQNQTAEENAELLEKIAGKAFDAGLDVVVYISMAFGNPYGDPWSRGRSCRSRGPDRGHGYPLHLAGRYRGAGHAGANCRAAGHGDRQSSITSKSARTCTAGATRRLPRSGRLRRRMPPLRLGYRRPGRMSLCAGRAGRQHSDGTGAGSTRAARGWFADPQAARSGDGDERRHRRPLFEQIAHRVSPSGAKAVPEILYPSHECHREEARRFCGPT